MDSLELFRVARTANYASVNTTIPLDKLLINAGQAYIGCVQ